jgi:hypothetical protein
MSVEIAQSDELLLLSNQKKDLLHQINKFKVQWEKIKVEKEIYLKEMTLVNQRVGMVVFFFFPFLVFLIL